MRKLTQPEIVHLIAGEFRCFGLGSLPTPNNPITAAMAERPPMFALGVEVAAVVRRVIELSDYQRTAPPPSGEGR